MKDSEGPSVPLPNWCLESEDNAGKRTAIIVCAVKVSVSIMDDAGYRVLAIIPTAKGIQDGFFPRVGFIGGFFNSKISPYGPGPHHGQPEFNGRENCRQLPTSAQISTPEPDAEWN
jgi:hypothetical protein